ncbi:hypothetical protein [Mitsuokella jalaludinii]|uniref:hypothetical protein n=1 Tax=Mitsuokella jalaludinii TaxID=187979 RepID=UPI003F9C509A
MAKEKISALSVPPEKVMLTIPEFTAVSGLPERHVRMLVHIDTFPAVRAGIRYLIHRRNAEKWLSDASFERLRISEVSGVHKHSAYLLRGAR